MSTLTHFPKAIVQGIGYKLARELLKLIENNEVVKDEWKGDLANVSYTYGGKINGNRKLTVNVYNYLESAKTYNTIGVIKGSTEPGFYF